MPPPRLATTRVAPPVDAAELIAELRRGEELGAARAARAGQGPTIPHLDPVAVAAMLRDAAADRAAVWVGVTDEIGDARAYLLLPDTVEGGRVRGIVDDTPRTFSIHRITGVARPG